MPAMWNRVGGPDGGASPRTSASIAGGTWNAGVASALVSLLRERSPIVSRRAVLVDQASLDPPVDRANGVDLPGGEAAVVGGHGELAQLSDCGDTEVRRNSRARWAWRCAVISRSAAAGGLEPGAALSVRLAGTSVAP
jgi:hypothetical protein